MVWFQCESCGENLKKPKLQNHFRGCAARKLSCIDCGVVFDQQSVQVHTSCVSETEKYGPKDGTYGSSQKPKGSQAHRGGDIDLSFGLSTGAPWNCSLCKVNTTSYETLEGHSQGKKHRAKAKAAQAKINSVSESKSLAETNGPEPVEDGKLLPAFTEEERALKKRKTGDEGEKKPSERKKKVRQAEEFVDASADESIISTENGSGGVLEVKNSATSEARVGKAVKWKKLTTRVLLKAPEKGVKELLPLVTSGAISSDKKALEKQLVETIR